MKTKKASVGTMLLFMCWLVYSMSYLGKVNYNATKPLIIDYFGVTKDVAGMVGTFFFFAYAIGMVLNGIFCKKYNIKWIVFGSLIISSAINLTIALLPKEMFWIIKFLWMINGVSLSVLWPSLIRLLSETLPKSKMPSASKVMGTTVATGTLLIYGLSAVFALFDNFKLSFLVPAIIGPTIAVIWLLRYNSFTAIEKEQEELPLVTEKQPLEQKKKGGVAKAILSIIICLAFIAVITNLVKDGLTSWASTFLKEKFSLGDSASILLSTAIPAMGIAANFLTVWLAGKIKNLILLETMFFAIGGVAVLVIILLLNTNLVVVTLICLMLTALIASGSNNIITSIFPLYMKGKVNSGLVAGILNGFCYVGSTISDYGLGAVQEATGSWSSVFYVLMFACLAVVLVAGIFTLNGVLDKLLHKKLGGKQVKE